MLLDKQRRIQLRTLYDDPKFQVVIDFLDVYRAVLSQASALGETEFETLKLTFQKEYQIILIDEIKRLLQEEAAAVGVDDND